VKEEKPDGHIHPTPVGKIKLSWAACLLKRNLYPRGENKHRKLLIFLVRKKRPQEYPRLGRYLAHPLGYDAD
jgi:hypothetical protein